MNVFGRLIHRLSGGEAWRRRIGGIGRGCLVDPTVEFRNERNIFLGDNVKVRRGVVLQANRAAENAIRVGDESEINPYVCIFGKADIGRYVMIAPHVMIAGGNHIIDDFSQPMCKVPRSTNLGVTIEDDVWVGANVCIVDGVRLGTGCVVGAGAVVTRDVAPFDIVVGNPAKVVGNRQERAKDES